MKELAKKFLIASIVLSSTQIITISGLGLSIYQVALMLTFGVCFLGIFEIRYIKKGQYLSFAAIAAVSSVVAMETSIYPTWARSYFLLGLLTALLCLFIPVYFSRDDIPQLSKALIRSQYITIAFSIYGFFKFYFGGGIPNKITLLRLFSIELEKEFFSRGQAAGQIRLALPYSTPPILSVVMAVCIIILLFDKELYPKIAKWMLVVIFSVILILTGSRTGLIGLVAFLLLEGVEHLLRNNFSISKRFFFVVFIAIIGVGIFGKMSGISVYLTKYIYRFANLFEAGTLSANRHLWVPVDGLIIWLSSVKNFFVGIGFGSSYYMQGAHTYLPPYFLNSFVTWIVERGVMGVYLIASLIYMLLKFKWNNALLLSAEKSIRNALYVVLISSMFYEVLNCYTAIIVVAICFVIVGNVEVERSEKNFSDYSGF